MILRANCKINIGLDILGRRDDGYHDIATVMYPVRELYDVVSVEKSGAADVRFAQTGLVVDCSAESNICVKAYRLMEQRYSVAGVDITLDKRVPFGAGLGGGSSDGTAVLLALNTIFDLQLSESTLIELAADLGSDTPFFVRNTPQLCTSRGEQMSPVTLQLTGMYLVVVKPDDFVSTREAYSGVVPKIPAVALAQKILRPVAEWQGEVCNGFEPHIFDAHPRIALLKRSLLDAGALYASMSGSGSALFGIFADEASAKKYTPPCDGVYLHIEQL